MKRSLRFPLGHSVVRSSGSWAAVAAARPFRVKRSLFDLRGLLRSDALVSLFAGGPMLIVRLTLADYHHFHFPASGAAGPARPIPGRYDAGGPYARRRLVPFFAENCRMVTRLVSDRFGLIGMVEIGALVVGSIRQCYAPDARVERGQEKGCFALGGSTVVLLFQPGAIDLDAKLLEMSRRGIETAVRVGEAIGRHS